MDVLRFEALRRSLETLGG